MLIGAHESVAGGVSQAFARAEAHGAHCLQLFTKTARAWKAPPLTEEEQRLFLREARRSGLPTQAHGSYLVNLATEDTALRKRSIDCVKDELSRCERLGVPSLIIHPGAHKDEQLGLQLICEALDEVHSQTQNYSAKICLETTAGQGNCLGWRFDHLASILEQVEAPDRLGVCLDTCHLFAAGYDISTRRGYEDVMEDFQSTVGLHKVRCIHLNDSKKGLGCRVDRHQEIGLGTLGLEPFRALVGDPRFEHVPAVLETPYPERYGNAIALLKSLAPG